MCLELQEKNIRVSEPLGRDTHACQIFFRYGIFPRAAATYLEPVRYCRRPSVLNQDLGRFLTGFTVSGAIEIRYE